MLKRSTAAAVAVAAALAAAPAAQAAEVRIFPDFAEGEKGLVAYNAAAGEVNTPTFTETAPGMVVADPTAVLTSSDESCEISDDGHTATCAEPDGVIGFSADLGDMDDTSTANVTGVPNETFIVESNLRVFGGDGDDTMIGSDTAADALAGGAGDDVLEGRGGEDDLADFPSFIGAPGQDDQGGTNTMRGGAGDDALRGGPQADELEGGEGDDFFRDDEGTNGMRGGPGGDSFLRQGTVDDTTPSAASIDGGEGLDEVSYTLSRFGSIELEPATPGATVRLDAAAPTTGNGTVYHDDTLAGIEDARGTIGADTLIGSAGANALDGSLGNDSITGGAGRDNLQGGADADSIDARDREGDRVRCAFGEPRGDPGDSATVDAADLVQRCPAEGAGTTTTPEDDGRGDATPPPPPAPQIIREQVPVPVVPPADTAAPDIAGTKLARRIPRATLLRRGYRVDVRSKDAQPNQVVATLTGRLKGRARIAAVGDVIVAQRTRTFTGRAAFRLRLTGKLRRAIRRGTRLRVLVEVRDAAGNTSRRSIRIGVR